MRRAPVLVAALALSACQTQMDHRPRLAMAAGVLQRLTPAPLWRAPAPDTDLGDLIEAGDGRLFGWTQRVDLGLEGGSMLPGNVVAVSAAHEAKVSEIPPSLHDATEAVPLGSLVLLLGRGAAAPGAKPELLAVALDPDTGAEHWRMSASGLLDIRPAFDPGIFVVMTAGSPLCFQARSIADGSVCWTTLLPADLGRTTALFAMGEDWLIAGARLVRINGRTGAVEQTSDIIGEVLAQPAPRWLDAGLLLATDRNELALVDGRGSLAWSRSVGGRPRSLTHDATRVFALVGEGLGMALVCLDPADGSIWWRRDIGQQARSAAVTFGDHVAFTTNDELRICSTADGSTVTGLSLPPRARRNRLPDHVFIRGAHLIVAGESFVGAADLGSRVWAWLHEVQGGVEFTYPARQSIHDKRVAEVAAAIGLSSDEARALREHDVHLFEQPGAVALARPTPDFVLDRLKSTAMWQDNPLLGTRFYDGDAAAARRQEWDRRWQNIETRYGDDPGALSVVGGTELAGREAVMAVERIRATLDQMVSMIGMYLELHLAVQRGVTAGKLYAERVERQRKHAVLRAHRQSVQAGYYLRPYRWADGNGLLVVDLDDGRWCELILAPREIGLEHVLIGIPPVRVVDQGRVLLTHGPGVDRSAWHDLDVVGETTVSRSILAFALPDLPMHPAGEYRFRSVVARGGG